MMRERKPKKTQFVSMPLIENLMNLALEGLQVRIMRVGRLIEKNKKDVEMVGREVKKIEAEVKDPLVNAEVQLFKDDLRFFSSMMKNRLSVSISKQNSQLLRDRQDSQHRNLFYTDQKSRLPGSKSPSQGSRSPTKLRKTFGIDQSQFLEPKDRPSPPHVLVQLKNKQSPSPKKSLMRKIDGLLLEESFKMREIEELENKFPRVRQTKTQLMRDQISKERTLRDSPSPMVSLLKSFNKTDNAPSGLNNSKGSTMNSGQKTGSKNSGSKLSVSKDDSPNDSAAKLSKDDSKGDLREAFDQFKKNNFFDFQPEDPLPSEDEPLAAANPAQTEVVEKPKKKKKSSSKSKKKPRIDISSQPSADVKRRKLKSQKSKGKTENTEGSTPRHPKQLPVQLIKMTATSPDKTKKSTKDTTDKPTNVSLDYQKKPTSFTDQKSLDDIDPASNFSDPQASRPSAIKGQKERSKTPGNKKSASKKKASHSIVSESKLDLKKPTVAPKDKSSKRQPRDATPRALPATKQPDRKSPTPASLRGTEKKPQVSPQPKLDRSRLSENLRPKPLMIEKKVSLTSETPKLTSPKPAKAPATPKAPPKKPASQTEPNTPAKPKQMKAAEGKKEPTSPARPKPAAMPQSPAKRTTGEVKPALNKSQSSNDASLSPAASTGKLIEVKSQKSVDILPPDLGPSTVSEHKQSLSSIGPLQVPKPASFSNKNSISMFPDRLDFDWLALDCSPPEITCVDSLPVEDFRRVAALKGVASQSPSKRNVGSKEGSKKDISGELFFEDDEEADLANMV